MWLKLRANLVEVSTSSDNVKSEPFRFMCYHITSLFLDLCTCHSYNCYILYIIVL